MAAWNSIRFAAHTSYDPLRIFPRIPQKLKVHRVAQDVVATGMRVD
jgi:hypothetical protein